MLYFRVKVAVCALCALTRPESTCTFAPSSVLAFNLTRFWLRRLSYLLFLLFYFASSYAISQERTRLIVSELQHSASHADQPQFDNGCEQVRNSYPNYQRAKPKTISIPCFGLAPLLHQLFRFSTPFPFSSSDLLQYAVPQ